MREKMSKQHPPAPTASAVGPTVIRIVGRPGTRSYLAPSYHPTTLFISLSATALKYQCSATVKQQHRCLQLHLLEPNVLPMKFLDRKPTNHR